MVWTAAVKFARRISHSSRDAGWQAHVVALQMLSGTEKQLVTVRMPRQSFAVLGTVFVFLGQVMR